MVYLIWCVTYADIKVLETLYNQHILTRTGTSTFPQEIHMTTNLVRRSEGLTGNSVFTTSPSKTSNRFCSGLPYFWSAQNVNSEKKFVSLEKTNLARVL